MTDNYEIHEDYVRGKVEDSPLEKFVKQNKFPWKMVIYIGLLIFTTMQALNSTKMVSDYQQPLLLAFKNSLLNLTEQHFHKTFYTLTDFSEHLVGITDTMKDLDDSFLSQVDISSATYVLDVYYKDYPLFNLTSEGLFNVSGKYNFVIENIEDGITQPFNAKDVDETKAFVQKVSSMRFRINNIYTISDLSDYQRLCHNWTINIIYNMAGMSHIIAYLDAHPTYCSNTYIPPSPSDTNKDKDDSLVDPKPDSVANPSDSDADSGSESGSGSDSTSNSGSSSEDTHSQPNSGTKKIEGESDERRYYQGASMATKWTHAPFGNTLNMLHFLVLGLALASFIYWWYYVYEMGLLTMTSRHAKHMNSPAFYNDIVSRNAPETNWENMSFMQKIKFFDTFFYINMVGNVFQIFGSIVAIYQNFVQAESNALVNLKEATIGFGCTCCWIYLIKFFTYDKQFAETTRLLKNSTAETMKFFIGILPVFMAFAFLGRCLFWKYEKFETLEHTIVALFSMMAGDVLRETYTDTSPEGVLSVVYISIWIVLFMSVVHNVFISIISGSFKNRYLEERYQSYFDAYSLGDKNEVSKWNIDQKEVMVESLSKEKEERVKKDKTDLDWMAYIRREDGADNYKQEVRDRIKQSEIEKDNVRATVLLKTEDVEKTLANMKDAVDEFCSLSKDKEEKTAVRKSFLKYLKDLHLHTVSELSSANNANAKNNSPTNKMLKRAKTNMDKTSDLDLNEKDE